MGKAMIDLKHTMERFKTTRSIEDAIKILDSAPMHRDLIPEENFVQIANRAPIAHIAIERGLKAILVADEPDAKPKKYRHDLVKIYKRLKYRHLRPETCVAMDFLSKAFLNAVEFFEFEVADERLQHLRTLETYLKKVGTEKAFNATRYWAIDEPIDDENPIPYFSPPLHREILCALAQVFKSKRQETVAQRVDLKIEYEMMHAVYVRSRNTADHYNKEIEQYYGWIRGQSKTFRQLFMNAVRSNFNVASDEFVKQSLQTAHDSLRESDDPAVQYFVTRTTYLPRGSERTHAGVELKIEWSNANKTQATMKTGAGACIGFAAKTADGAWSIVPYHNVVSQIAEDFTDAKFYLINNSTHLIDVATNDDTRQLRIVGDQDFRFISSSEFKWDDPIDRFRHPEKYPLEFWDNSHGLNVGDSVKITHRRKGGSSVVSILEGGVKTVDKHRVEVVGWHCLYPASI